MKHGFSNKRSNIISERVHDIGRKLSMESNNAGYDLGSKFTAN
jgi:hypothetical protein